MQFSRPSVRRLHLMEVTMDKQDFEKIEEAIEAHRDDLSKLGEKASEFAGKLKDAKKGWEDAHAEGNHDAKIAHQEETHQTH